MMLIDTTDPEMLYGFKKKKEELDYRQVKKGFYDVNDFALVRTTDFLNPEHILHPICKVPFVTYIGGVISQTIYDILKEKYYNDFNGDYEKYEEFTEMLAQFTKRYTPLSSQYRSTVHFTLNGLVASHSKGSFDNRNFIVIDKLSNHLGIDDFRSIRMEDSFVFGDFPISDEATVLIEESKYKQLIEKYPYLSTYNIVLFRGDEKLASEMFLALMNIVPEKIMTHSAEESNRSALYRKYFSLVTEKYGIVPEKHCHSPEYKADDQKSLILWKIYDTNFYNELFDYFFVEKEEKENMINYLTSSKNNNCDQVEMLKKFIIKVVVERYQEFVVSYNQRILDAISQGIYPTNEEILAAGCIKLKNNKKTL